MAVILLLGISSSFASEDGPAEPAKKPPLAIENAAAAASRISVQAGDREIVIVARDPHVELTLLRGGRSLRIRDTKTDQSVELDVGSMTLLLERGGVGVRLAADEFTMTRSGDSILEVRAKKPGVPSMEEDRRWLGYVGPAELRPGETTTFAGHERRVESVAFSPDGRYLASAGSDGTARIWEVASGRQVRRIKCPAHQVFVVRFSPDGRWLAAGGIVGGVAVWEWEKGIEIRRLDRPAWTQAVAFLPKGDRLLAGGRGSAVHLWDLTTGKEIRAYGQPMEFVSSLAVSPDGQKALAAGGYMGGGGTMTGIPLRVWDLDHGETMFQLQVPSRGQMTNAVFTTDGKGVVAPDPSDENRLSIWNLATEEKTTTLRDAPGVREIALSPDGRQALALTAPGSAALLDVERNRCSTMMSKGNEFFKGPAFSPDGRLAAWGNQSGTITVWRVPQPPDISAKSRRELRRFGNGEPLAWAGFSPDGRTVLTSQGQAKLTLWDVETGQRVKSISAEKGYHSFRAVTRAADSRFALVVCGGMNDRLLVWDVVDWKASRTHSSSQFLLATCVAVSPDGRFAVAGGAHGSVVAWDLSAASLLARYHAPAQPVQSVAIASSGMAAIAPGSGRATPVRAGKRYHRCAIQLWNAPANQESRELAGHESAVQAVAFSSDGSRLLSGSQDQTLRIWNTKNGQDIRVIRVGDGVFSVAWSKDGRYVASGAQHGTVDLWDAESGLPVERFVGHEASVVSVAFSPDHRCLMSASSDGSIRLWNLPETCRITPAIPTAR